MFTDNLLKGRESNPNNQSFLCNATQTFHTNETGTGNTTRATLTVQDLQMQAFSFSNSTSGVFDEGKSSSNVYSLELFLSLLPPLLFYHPILLLLCS